jgi:gas vesicle protein
MSDNHKTYSRPRCGSLTAFFFGALAGAVAALWFALRSGQETRQLIADLVRKLQGDREKANE